MGAGDAAAQSGSATAAPSPRLTRAAHEFEAQMMKELLKPLTGSSALDGDDRESDAGLGSGSGGALGEFATEALGQALSEQGGFGIASGIIHELSHSKTKLEGGKSNQQMAR
jgi:Rod binding domain-containing protein